MSRSVWVFAAKREPPLKRRNMKFAYEITRVQAAEGYIEADSVGAARQQIFEDLYDIDWDSDSPDLDLWPRE